MKKHGPLLLILALSTALLSCDPLDKKYEKEKYSEVMADHADSANRSAFNRATVENDVNDVRNEDFTYQELIDQGKALQKKDLTKSNMAR
ncbi:hypothetical protein GCM10027299_46370 [Larkinella ripae]